MQGLALFAPIAVQRTVAAQRVAAPPVVPAASVKAPVALAGSVPEAVATATKLAPLNANQPLSALIHFKFADPQAAQNYVDAVSDPHSLFYGQWLTPQEIADRFGPSANDNAALLQFAQANGLQADPLPTNRMSLRVRGTVAQIQKAFGVTLNRYQESAAHALAKRGPNAAPYTFFATETPVKFPAAFAGKIAAVTGLENYSRPTPRFKKRQTGASLTTGPFDAVTPRVAYNLAPFYNSGLQGQGRTVAISNFDGFNVGNAANYISRNGLPTPASGAGSNIQIVTVDTPSGATGQGEGDLDFQMVLSQAPLADILIYDSGQQDLVATLTQEASENRADLLTESYGWQIDPYTAAAAHDQHVIMTMQGQTYLVASGDSGDVVNSVYQYSDYEPEVLIVGGSTLSVNSATNAYSGETGWSGSGGGSSPYTIDYNVLPAWQTGRNVPLKTTINQRLSPDIAAHSFGNRGAFYIFYHNGSAGNFYGTSCAAPLDAGALAVVEQYLIGQNSVTVNSAGKQRLGRLNDTIYGFNGRSDIFHDITSGNNGYAAAAYWDYVTGWGSVDWANFAAALQHPLSVTVAPAAKTLTMGQTAALTATVAGSNVTGVTWSLVSGPGSVSAAGVYTAPAAVSTAQTAVVQATSVIDTANPGNDNATVRPDPVFGRATLTINPPAPVSVSGTVALDGIADPKQTVLPVNPLTFVLKPTAGGTPISTTQAPGAGGAFTLTNVPVGSYTLTVKGDKWLRSAVTVNAAGNVTGVSLFLPGGDANNDNAVDVLDFGVLVNAYGTNSAIVGSAYDARADFNCDGLVDVLDFGLLVNSYGLTGQ